MVGSFVCTCGIVDFVSKGVHVIFKKSWICWLENICARHEPTMKIDSTYGSNNLFGTITSRHCISSASRINVSSFSCLYICFLCISTAICALFLCSFLSPVHLRFVEEQITTEMFHCHIRMDLDIGIGRANSF